MDAAIPMNAPPTGTLWTHGRAAASTGAVALVSLLAFEAMAVAAAMPAIAAALDGLMLYALAFGGALAATVLGLVAAGGWIDRRGPLPATTTGLGLFTAGLLVAGFAPDMRVLVAGRVLQGLGSGLLGVALYAGMGRVVPKDLHPRLFALLAAAWVVPALVGPALAAALVDWLGWRAVFLVAAGAAPLAALLLLPAYGRLGPAQGEDAQAGPVMSTSARVGWATLAAAGALLLHVGSAAAAWGWALVAIGLAGALIAAARLLPRGSLVATPGLPAVIALRGLLASAFASAEVFLPLALTREAGWTIAQAGLVLSGGAVMWTIGSQVQARLQGPRHRRAGLHAGYASVAAGIAAIAAVFATGAHPAWVAVAWAVAGLGIGLSFPMLSVLTLALSAADAQGRNASALQLSDALASSAVLAVSGVLYAGAGGAGPQGPVAVFALATGVGLVGLLVARRAFAGATPPREG